MQSTSATYQQIMALDYHDEETKLVVNGVEYAENEIFTIESDGSVFGDYGYPVLGRTTARTLEAKILDKNVTIPDMARVEPYMRITGEGLTSEWLPKGKFNVNLRRATDSGIVTLECYDDMIRANDSYTSSSLTWPAVDISIVNEIAAGMGVSVDARTTAAMTHAYRIPTYEGYTKREILGYIGGLYGGGWVMSDEGELLLVTLRSLPGGTDLLVDESGNVITFGGVGIYVG